MSPYKAIMIEILDGEGFPMAEGKHVLTSLGFTTALIVFGGSMAVTAPKALNFLEEPMFVDVGETKQPAYEVNLDVLKITPGSNITPSQAYTELYLKACQNAGKDPKTKPFFKLEEPELFWLRSNGKKYQVFYGHDFFYYKDGDQMRRIPAMEGLAFIGA